MAESTLLTEADNGRLVSLPAGSWLQVSLPENATTGYRWSPDDPPAGVLSLESAEPAPPGAADAGIGAAGGRIFRFLARGAGEVTLHLRLVRAWNPGEALRHFRAHVTVRRRRR